VVTTARPGDEAIASRLVFDPSAGAAGVLDGQRDIGQEPDRHESLQLAARDHVGPVDLRPATASCPRT
jgi:hypothetical protein